MGKRNKITFWLSLLAVVLSITAMIWVGIILASRSTHPPQITLTQQISPLLGNELNIQPRRIIVAGDDNYPPYSYLDNGEPAGFDVDIIRAAAQAVGVDVEIKLMPWEQALQTVLEGKADVISGMAYSPEGKQFFEFSNPYTAISFDIFTRKNSKISHLPDLENKCVLVQKGGVMEEYLGTIAKNITPDLVESPVEALERLSSGECDAAIINRVQGYLILKQAKLSNLHALDIRILPADYGFAALPKNDHLIKILNEGLSIIKEKGVYQDFSSKWFGLIEEQSFLEKSKILIYGFILVLIILLAVVSWVWALRREVKKKTQDLGRSEKKYRKLVENVSEAVLLTFGGVIVFCNTQAEQLLGSPLLGLTYNQLIERVHQEDVSGVIAALHEWEKSDEIKQKTTTQIIVPGDELRWVNIVREKIDWEGQPAILSLVLDVTQEKMARLALEESENKFRTAFESAAIGLVISGIGGEILQANGAFCDYLGYSAQELTEMTWREVTHPEDVKKNEELRRISLANQNVFQLEKRYVRKDGTILWAEMSTALMKDASGQPMYYITHVQDISEKKEAEETVRSLAKFPQENPSPVLRVDHQGNILYANPFSTKILRFWGKEVGDPVPEDFFTEITRGIELQETVQFGFAIDDRNYNFLARSFDEDGYINLYGMDVTERDQAMEELAQSEQQFHLLFNRSPIGLFRYDLNLKITDINDYMIRLLEFGHETALEKDLTKVNDLRLIEALKAPLERVEGHYNGKFWASTAKKEIFVDIHTAPIMTEDGELLGGMALCTDLTEKVERENELHQLEDKFTIAFKASLDGLAISRLSDGMYLDVNRGFAEMTGYSENEIIGKTIDEIQLWQSDADQEKLISEILEKNEIKNLELTFIRKDGKEFTGLLSAAQFVINGEPCVISLTRDISERKRFENEVRASEERFRRLFEESPVGIEVFDQDGNLVNVNLSFLEIFGLPNKDVLSGYNLFDVNSIAGLSRLDFGNLNYLRFEKEFNFSQFNLNGIETSKSGKVFLEITATILSKTGEANDLEGYLIQVHDITERKQGEEKLRESEKRFRTFFESASVSLWEEDFTQVVQWIDQKKKEGIVNLNSTLDANPRILRELAKKVIVRDVNDAALRMYHCESKAQLCNSIDRIFCDESYLEFKRAIQALFNGEVYYEGETPNLTLTGEKINTLITTNFPFQSGDFSRVLVSLTDITGLKKAEERVNQQVQHLAALRAVDMAISASMDMNITLRVLLNQVKQQLSVDAVAILLLNPHTQMLDCAAATGFRPDTIENVHLHLGQSYAGRAALERQLVISDDLSDPVKSQIITPSLQKENYEYFAGIPLTARGVVKGVLEVFGYRPFPSDAEWMNLFEAMASQAAIAIDNAAMFDEVQRANTNLILAYDATIEGWARALEMRDGETEGHSKRVTEQATRLAAICGIPDEELVHVRRGAFLHDIGKMSIPDRILLKPGPLTDKEWQIMHMHPIWGKQLLDSIDFLKPAIIIPYCHHEKWDGTGYPRGLKGEEIPLAARVFSIIDGFDALSSDRPYRKAWSRERILNYLKENAGIAYDPEVVKRFMKMIEK